jgi:hypothetical protein
MATIVARVIAIPTIKLGAKIFYQWIQSQWLPGGRHGENAYNDALSKISSM